MIDITRVMAYILRMPRHVKSLPKNVYDLIAAGEVIHSPAAVVKELVENALDAGSGRVTVTLSGGGRELIRVEDDGHGVHADDFSVLATRHATSKISRAADIQRINSLGFRGEALFSLTQVAHLDITSARRDADGMRLTVINGDRDVKPHARPTGTTVSVRHLFYNTPARLKQLQKNRSAVRQIRRLMEDFAFIHPRTAFTFIHDNRTVCRFDTAEPERRLVDLLGDKYPDGFLTVDGGGDDCRVRGIVSRCEFGANNRSRQHCFLNGRISDVKSFYHAVTAAYSRFPQRFPQPMVYLSVEIPPECLDVNIHPNKKEIKLFEESRFHDTVYHAVKETLSREYDLTPASTVSAADAADASLREASPSPSVERASLYEQEGRSGGRPALREAAAAVTGSVPEERTDEAPEVVHLATLYDTYPLVLVDGTAYLLDQHASAERIAYDRMRAALRNGGMDRQLLLVPARVSRGDVGEARLRLLERFGFDSDPIGEDELAVRSVPALLADAAHDTVAAMVEEVLSLPPDEDAPPKQLDRVLKSMACRTSVMAHDRLTPREITELINDLWRTETPLICPHGRPTVVMLDPSTLEKMFGRQS